MTILTDSSIAFDVQPLRRMLWGSWGISKAGQQCTWLCCWSPSWWVLFQSDFSSLNPTNYFPPTISARGHLVPAAVISASWGQLPSCVSSVSDGLLCSFPLAQLAFWCLLFAFMRSMAQLAEQQSGLHAGKIGPFQDFVVGEW